MWKAPKLLIDPPKDAIRDGLLPVIPGMLAWRNRRNRYVVVACGWSSDPEANNEKWWKAATEGLRQDQIEREYLISFNSRGGSKVFPFLEYAPEKYTRPATDYRKGREWIIPQHWPLLGGLDYGGTQNPTSINFYAIDDNKMWHSIWEFYKPAHYKEISEVLLAHPLYSRLLKIVVDPSIFKRDQQKTDGEFTSVGDLLISVGIDNLEEANRERIAGLARVHEQFNQRSNTNERPTFIVFSTDCPEQWRELTKIIYKEESEIQLLNKNPADDVIKKDDHSYDNLRYTLMSWDSSGEAMPKKRPQFRLDVIEEEIEKSFDDENFNDLFN